jgi:hypothetical protein
MFSQKQPAGGDAGPEDEHNGLARGSCPKHRLAKNQFKF